MKKHPDQRKDTAVRRPLVGWGTANPNNAFLVSFVWGSKDKMWSVRFTNQKFTTNPYNSKKINHIYQKPRILGLKFCSLREPCGTPWLIYQDNLRLLPLSTFRWIICSKIQLALNIIWLFLWSFWRAKKRKWTVVLLQ